jgi:hypothetical protein
MNKLIRRVLPGLLVSLLILLLAACEGVAAPGAASVVESETETTVATAPAPKNFAIDVEPIGHWHVSRPKTLLFTVAEVEGNTGQTGLDLVVQIARADSLSVSERSVEKEQVKDEGEGIYSLEYTPSSIGAYGLVARFTYEGQEFVSKPVAFEVARDGEEGVRVDAQDTTYVYQVRYNWDPGHVHASDDEEVNLVFEIMRGIPEGNNINWDQPWQNVFNHVIDAETPKVVIESEDGSVSDEIEPVYKGKGIYEAQRTFSVAEVGEGQEYEVHFVFTDPYNGAEVTHPEAYHLHAAPPH